MRREVPPQPTLPRARAGLPPRAALLCLLWGLAAAPAAGDAIPGPPLDVRADAPGAFCPPRGDAGLGGVGFAGALAAIAVVARRRREPA